MAASSEFVEENPSMLKETIVGEDLHEGRRIGYEVLVDKIIELYPTLISSINSKGDTPLHLAATLGHTNLLPKMLNSKKSHNPCETETPDLSKVAEMMNKDGSTPLHCAAMKGQVEIMREFLEKAPSLVTLEKKEPVFHEAVRHKNANAFIFMAKSANLGQLLYQLDVEGNTVLHVAASVGSLPLVKYIIEETRIEVSAKNKKGFVAFDLLNKDDKDFLQLSTALMCVPQILFELPSSPKEMRNSENQVADEENKLQKEMLRVQSRDSPKKLSEMQLEALQNARNTLTIVAVLIASVAFTCGINPPGGVHQEGNLIGKATVVRTFAFMIFSISNSIALFTSVCMVLLLVSIIPYREDSLLKFLIIAHRMMWVAVAAMGSAYVSAVSVTLPHSGETKWLFYTILAIAILTLGGMFVYLRFKLAKCVLRKVNLIKCLSNTPLRKNGSLDMVANISKGYYSY